MTSLRSCIAQTSSYAPSSRQSEASFVTSGTDWSRPEELDRNLIAEQEDVRYVACTLVCLRWWCLLAGTPNQPPCWPSAQATHTWVLYLVGFIMFVIVLGATVVSKVTGGTAAGSATNVSSPRFFRPVAGLCLTDQPLRSGSCQYAAALPFRPPLRVHNSCYRRQHHGPLGPCSGRHP